MTEIKRIGFFHFGSGHETPMASLRCAISHPGDVADSLVVLPEAFNLGRLYVPGVDCAQALDLFLPLEDTAQEFKVAFIACLMVKEKDKIYNAAYLIDPPSKRRLICCKKNRDAIGNYSECDSQCKARNPIEHRGACIAALICKDVDDPELLDNIVGRLAGPCPIVCVPACTNDQFQGGRVPHVIGPPWEGTNLIMANSKPIGDSFIKTRGCTETKRFPGNQDRDQNALVLVELDTATDSSTSGVFRAT